MKPNWTALREVVLNTDKEVLKKALSGVDGHTIYDPTKFLEAGLSKEVVAAFTQQLKSDLSNPKAVIYNNEGQVIKGLRGVHGLALLEFIASVFGVSSWKMGRGSRAEHLLEQLFASDFAKTI